jgi:hypothetical protein
MPSYEVNPNFKSKYKILPAQEKNARKMGLEIVPSLDSGKKIDVMKDGKKVASIGGRYFDGVWYGDYHTYKKDPKDRYGNKVDAEQRKRAYLKRHEHEKKNDKRKGKGFTPSFYADRILWS